MLFRSDFGVVPRECMLSLVIKKNPMTSNPDSDKTHKIAKLVVNEFIQIQDSIIMECLNSCDEFISQYNINKKIVDFNEIPVVYAAEFFDKFGSVISEIL